MFIDEIRPQDLNPEQKQAAVQLALNILSAKVRKGAAVMESPEAIRNYLACKLGNRGEEFFGCVYMDNRHRVIKCEEVFRGTINAATVYPRTIVKEALLCDAAALVIFHNHPSGVTEPSAADKVITDRIKDACNLVEIRLLDHFIVGGSDVLSFAERGML